MSKQKAPKSWAEQLADLDDPAPKGRVPTRCDMLEANITRRGP